MTQIVNGFASRFTVIIVHQPVVNDVSLNAQLPLKLIEIDQLLQILGDLKVFLKDNLNLLNICHSIHTEYSLLDKTNETFSTQIAKPTTWIKPL